VLAGVQISPLGDWPNGDVVQHVNRAAAEAMVASWREAGAKEVLCDFEHNAEHGGETTAAAWISNLRIDPARGLMGDFRFTDVGAEAVSARRLRFLSPCWQCNVDRWAKGDAKPAKDDAPAEVTPFTLVSVALTNKPNIPVAPPAPTSIRRITQSHHHRRDHHRQARGRQASS